MTKQQPAARTAIAVSPSLSLREAVRPLIFAHALLARERELAEELARECRKLEQLTRAALEAAALVHLLVLAPDRVADDTDASRRDQLIKAYAKAATTWAEVTGTAIALADALLDADRPDDVYRLASFLEAAGEPATAQDLRTRADATVRRSLEARLGRIHDTMTEPEIAVAIEALRECKDETAASFYIRDVAQAIVKALLASREEEYALDFGTSSRHIYWHVAPGDAVSTGANMCTLTGNTYPYQIPFPAMISKLLVTAGSVVTGSMAIASVIRLPAELAAELQIQQPVTRDIFARLETVARVFWQIQAENARSPRPSE